MRLAIDRIIVSKDNPRKSFDEESLRRLGESIRDQGQLQPIVVRARGQSFELIVGERRLRASALVGLSSIDAEVRDVDDVTAMEFRLIENTQREDLTDAEKGDAVLQLWAFDKYETIKDVAKAINIPYGTIKTHWIPKSRKLSPKVRGKVAVTSLTNEHAYQLMKYPHSTQDKLADVIIRKKISSHKDVLRPFLKSFDADPSADLDTLADEALGIETVKILRIELPEEVYKQYAERIEEKKQLAKVHRVRKKPSKPITKAEVIKKFEDKKKKIANGSFKFEKVRVIQGVKGREPPLKRQIKPLVVPIPNTPDYSLCKCGECSLFGKHCKGRSET